MLEAQGLAAGENGGEARSDVAGRLGAAEEDCGVIEQRAVGCSDFLELVHEAGHAGAKHFVPVTQGDDVGVVGAPISTPFVVDVMSTALLGSGFLGPDLVVVIVRTRFPAQTLGGDTGHIGLKGQNDQVGHQLNVFLKTVLGSPFEANLGFVELGASVFQDRLLLEKAFLDVTHRVKVLVDTFLVDASELALDVLYVAHGGIEDTPIEGQALLLLSDFSPVGGRKEALEDLTVVGRRRNVHPKRIARKRGHSHPARPGKNERIKVGGSEMLRGHLIDRDRVGLGAGNEVDVVPGQPVVWMDVTTDTPFDMGKAGEYGKMVAVMSKGLVGSGKRIVRTGILRKPLVLAYGAGNVETGEAGRIPSLQSGGQRLAPKSIKKRQRQGCPQSTQYRPPAHDSFFIHRAILSLSMDYYCVRSCPESQRFHPQ